MLTAIDPIEDTAFARSWRWLCARLFHLRRAGADIPWNDLQW